MKRIFIKSGEFAKLCNTSKETLRHYKNIGLLNPKYKDNNGYFYYDTSQFYTYYAISILKKTGTSLAKIKNFINNQNSESILKILNSQQQILEEEKIKLEQMQFITKTSIENISIGLEQNSNFDNPKIKFFEEEHLLAISEKDFSITEENKNDENSALISVLHKFKTLCKKYKVQTNYQLGSIMELSTLKISHLYMKLNKKYKIHYYLNKPKGNYLYLIHKYNWNIEASYKKLYDYIKNENIKTTGKIYSYDLAGFMINEIEDNFMTMISIKLDE